MKFNRYSRALPKNKDLINKRIRFPKVMLIGENGPLGEMSSREAYAKAQEANLDLVCVSPNATPPICKLLDYGKYKFEKSKKEKESKKNRTVIIIKEVRLTPNIGDHDLKTKAKKAYKFLESKFKVKVSLKYRGREHAHREVGIETLNKFAELVQEVAVVEKSPFANGRFYDMILAPIKKK